MMSRLTSSNGRWPSRRRKPASPPTWYMEAWSRDLKEREVAV
jgi:hypothetical protein